MDAFFFLFIYFFPFFYFLFVVSDTTTLFAPPMSVTRPPHTTLRVSTLPAM